MGAIGRWGSVQIDCTDPVALAAFWADILGSEVDETIGDPPHYVVVRPPVAEGPWLSFQRVPEAKGTKNRLHLDFVVDDLDSASSRITELGGRPALGMTGRNTATDGGSFTIRRATSSA